MAGEGERSISAVLADIVGNIQQIVRAEIRLATVEVSHEIGKARRGVTLLIIGGATAALAPAFILVAAVYALATVFAPWIAALIVATAAGIIGGTCIAVGMKQMQQVAFAPPRTIATIEENIQWAKTPNR
jgi:uncharacterized membrane protein YqjE